MHYTVMGISSGIGVSLFPFKNHLIANIEPRAIFHSPGEHQWKANFGNIPLLKEISANLENPTVIISSPDCGSGSILRMSRAKSYGDHKKNDSLALFFEGVARFKPMFFEMENLNGLFKSFPEEDFALKLPGYRLIKHVAPVSMWGNSQISRERLVVIGIREDITRKVDKYFALPDLRHLNKTCIELYGDLDNLDDPFDAKELCHLREHRKDLTTIHAGKKLPNDVITKVWQTELKGKRRWEVIGRKFSTAPGVYRNRKNDYPATARKANRQYDHTGQMLTPRQLARVQGVPDEFILYMPDNPDQKKLKYWINKGRAAVTKTPPMEISMWFKQMVEKALKKHKKQNL